jgi:PAS domain S-box-containing protein
MAKVLIVDDEAAITTQLEERLAVMGYDVVGTASTGEEAVGLARDHAPDIILMDIVMPGDMDGIEAARLIRQEMDIPVVFLTAYGDDRFIERAKDVGPYGYIIKPYQENALKAAIEIALYNHEVTRCLEDHASGWRRLTENMEEAVILCDAEGKVFFWNRGAENIFGYAASEIAGRTFGDLVSEGTRKEYLQEIEQLFTRGDSALCDCWVEVVGVRKDYSRFYMEMCLSPWTYQDEKAFIGVVRDITQRKKDETRFETSLQEKDRLLDDVRRSVQENLQLIYSLIDLQKACVESREGLKGLGVGRSRLEALLYAQERVSGPEAPTRIDFAGYVRNLTARLFRSYGVEEERIALDLDIESLPLDLRTATACGLIVSELVSNSFKYAFPDASRKGRVNIGFTRRGEDYVLRIRDDGIGFPQDQDFPGDKTQGLRVVADLVDHLEGEISLERDGGTGFEVVFPVSE